MALRLGQLPPAIGDEAEPEVDQGVVALAFGLVDRRRLEPAQRQRILHPGERITQPLERGARVRLLAGERRDGGQGQHAGGQPEP
jgi:hypothetical protein